MFQKPGGHLPKNQEHVGALIIMIKSIDETKCTGCGICVQSCALDTIRLDEVKGGIA
jgi:ferredoxin